ncbi:MAG: hypothetical protein KDB26_06580 [Microthrixaceae bacterium]|nr:hypothetical protein [Microthrixaceae bacterium]
MAGSRVPPGVFCLEGPWSAKLTDRSSVRPILEVLEAQKIIRFAHRDAITHPEFESYVKQWTEKQYAQLAFGYFAFHGDPGLIWVGSKPYTLCDLASLCEGKLAGRIIHFGACSTLDIDEAEAMDFVRRTKARAICGYSEVVDSIESVAFDMNIIYAVTDYDRIDAGFKSLQKNHHGMCERLGLRAVWNGGSIF